MLGESREMNKKDRIEYERRIERRERKKNANP